MVASLGMDPMDAQLRSVVFFDTPDLTLNEAGVVVRARRIQGKRDDTVIKLRPVVPRTSPRRCGSTRSVSRSTRRRRARLLGVDEGVAGKHRGAEATPGAPDQQLFTKEQRAFYDHHASGGPSLDDLSILGPVYVLKLKQQPEGFPRKIVGEMWLYPDGKRIVELSMKCMPQEAFQVAAESRAFFAERGIDIRGEQQMKTKTALEFFSKELTAQA